MDEPAPVRSGARCDTTQWDCATLNGLEGGISMPPHGSVLPQTRRATGFPPAPQNSGVSRSPTDIRSIRNQEEEGSTTQAICEPRGPGPTGHRMQPWFLLESKARTVHCLLGPVTTDKHRTSAKGTGTKQPPSPKRMMGTLDTQPPEQAPGREEPDSVPGAPQ